MDTVRQARQGIVWVYNQMHWFTDREAWWIFRLGAILETIGWSLLISAIIWRANGLPMADAFISVAGRIHGMFFVAYFAAVLATFRSMEWGFWRFASAVLLGMPPFTSLVFEKAMAWHRKKYPKEIAPPRNIDE